MSQFLAYPFWWLYDVDNATLLPTEPQITCEWGDPGQPGPVPFQREIDFETELNYTAAYR